MNHIKQTVLISLLASAIGVSAQSNSYDKLGMQAWMKGDYKTAVTQLEKADVKEPNNTNILKMLGYSYYQCGDFENAITTYSKFIALKPADYSAYYYRGKARLNVANDPKESLNEMRENFYLSAIRDFTKAIEIKGEEEDAQLFQNRALAYKDYGIYKSYKIRKSAERKACIELFNNSIADFNKILVTQPLRKDIISLIDYVKAQASSLK